MGLPRSIRRGSALLEVGRVADLREVHGLDQLDQDVRAVRLTRLVVGDVVVAGVGDRYRVVLLEAVDGPLLVPRLGLPESAFLVVVERLPEPFESEPTATMHTDETRSNVQLTATTAKRRKQW